MSLRLCLVLLCISVSLGANFFESALIQLECFPGDQPGCKNRDFVDAHPHLRWSFTNLTLATTRFYMFTKDNPDEPELMHKCGGELPPKTKFNPKCRTEIIIPGYASEVCNFAIYRELKNERLRCGCCPCYNVLLVDWMWGNFPDLVDAKENAKIVARQVALVIKKLKKRYSLCADDFILTGHSVGAHIASFIANLEPVCSINGLDPAGVVADYAETAPRGGRLDASDASCVQVFHTNAGPCLPGFLGLSFSCGTADFWFNGGQCQPSCYLQVFEAILKGDWYYALISLYPPVCSHLQALQYYKASMCPTDCQFIGVECDCQKSFDSGTCCRDCGKHGERCAAAGAYACDCLKCRNKTENRNYYLNTTPLCPYCDNSGINTKGVKCGIKAPTCECGCGCRTGTPKCETKECKCGTKVAK